MFRIGICDDNRAIADKLARLIKNYGLEKDLELETEIYYSGKDLLDARRVFDILFLDIEMPEIDGIDTAKQIRQIDRKVKIIFISSYSQYALNAYVVHPFQYLVKPFSIAKVEMTLLEVIDYIEKERKSQDIQLVIQSEMRVFNTNDIYYFERCGRKVKMVTMREELMFSGTLSEISEKINDASFEYCHKSIIVNLFHVKRIKGFDIFLDNDMTIPLAQKRSVTFKEQLFNYMQENFKML